MYFELEYKTYGRTFGFIDIFVQKYEFYDLYKVFYCLLRLQKHQNKNVNQEILLYGGETWALRKKEEQILESTEMRWNIIEGANGE